MEENRKEMADAEKEKAYSVLMENIKLKKHKENVDQRIKVRKLTVVLIKDQSICDGRYSREFHFDIFFSAFSFKRKGTA